MKLLVVGAGAIGQWIGANMLQAGHEVVFAGRAGFAEAARRDGLHVQLPDGDAWHLQDVRAHADVAGAAEAMPFDAIALCVKAYSVESALNDLRSAGVLASQSSIICFQNGLGAEEMCAREVDRERVIAGTLTSAVSLVSATTVKLERAKGGVGLAPFKAGAAHGFDAIANAFADSPLLRVQCYANANSMKWSKLLLNLVGNATSALFQQRVADLLSNDFTARIEMRQLREAAAVMQAAGVPAVNLPGAPSKWFALALRTLPDALLRWTLQRFFAKARGDKWPSFYYDALNQTGRSEVMWLNGAVGEWGRRAGVPTPVNDALTRRVLDAVNGHAVTQDEIAREFGSADKPGLFEKPGL